MFILGEKIKISQIRDNTKRLFGIVMFLNYIIYYFIFDYYTQYNNLSFIMRAGASIICLPLICFDFTTDNLSPYKKLYWYLVVLYCLPFFFSFMTFLNNLSVIWLMNSVSAGFLMIMVIDLYMFFILLFLGFFSALILYTKVLSLEILFYPGAFNIYDIVATYFAIIVIGSIFAYNRESVARERKGLTSYINKLNLELEKKVKERTKELNTALQVKTEFLNNISHEIRTPVQGFSVISESLVEHWDEFDNKRRLELAGVVASNARRLTSLIGNLLDLSKFSASKFHIELKKQDIGELVRSIIEECKELYLVDKKIKINYETKNKLYAMVDAERILQVLRNLLINSIKFSPDRTTINIVTKESEVEIGNKKEPAIYWCIEDVGIGIPVGEEESIFEPFTQSTNTKTKAGGTGLGLSIAKNIVEAHNGKIWASNYVKDGVSGARFEFIIPTKLKENNKHHHARSNNLLIKQSSNTEPKINVLMIDDEETCLLTMELMLKYTNYNLFKANSFMSAVKFLNNEHPGVDIILLDLMMPEIDGIETLREIRKYRNLDKVPVILQSGASDQADIQEAFNLGVVSFIKKPYNKESIINELTKFIDAKHINNNL